MNRVHYHATHPMSYHGDGVVSHDFVGIARERRTRDDALPHVKPHPDFDEDRLVYSVPHGHRALRRPPHHPRGRHP